MVVNYLSISLSKGLPVAVLMTKVDIACSYVAEDVSTVYRSHVVKEAADLLSQKLGIPKVHILPVSKNSLVAYI